MAQWVNHLKNNIFVNPPPSPLLCEIFRALHLAQSGLMAGRQADKIQVNFENLSRVFQKIKLIGRLFNEVQKNDEAIQFLTNPKPYNFLPIPTIKYYHT